VIRRSLLSWTHIAFEFLPPVGTAMARLAVVERDVGHVPLGQAVQNKLIRK
jgi:hypothetical protein